MKTILLLFIICLAYLNSNATNEYHCKLLERVLANDTTQHDNLLKNMDYLRQHSKFLLEKNTLDDNLRFQLYAEILLNYDFFNQLKQEAKKMMLNAMVQYDKKNNQNLLYNYSYRELSDKLQEILVNELQDYVRIDFSSKIPQITDNSNNKTTQLESTEQLEYYAKKRNVLKITQ